MNWNNNYNNPPSNNVYSLPTQQRFLQQQQQQQIPQLPQRQSQQILIQQLNPQHQIPQTQYLYKQQPQQPQQQRIIQNKGCEYEVYKKRLKMYKCLVKKEDNSLKYYEHILSNLENSSCKNKEEIEEVKRKMNIAITKIRDRTSKQLYCNLCPKLLKVVKNINNLPNNKEKIVGNLDNLLKCQGLLIDI